MSDLFFNVRIGLYHFQIGRNRPWIRISRNDFHKGALGKSSPWVEFY